MVANAPIHHDWDAAILDAWRPRERLTVSQWADRYRVLQGEYAAEPGPWRTARTPYLQGIMDAFTERGIRRIVARTAARLGKTESVNNMLGYAIDQAPGPVLYVYPRESDAREECRDRIQRFVEGSPRLRSCIPHPAWAKATDLELNGMQVYMAWASSPTTLVRRTIRYAFVDELDNCDKQAGVLGDTLSLVEKRLTTYRDRGRLAVVSSPTTPKGRTNQLFVSSDRRQYHVPCPACGVYQVLTLAQIRTDGEKDADRIELEDDAYYECLHCQAKLRDGPHKMWMLERGVWLPESQTIEERLPVRDAASVERARFDHPQRWMPRIHGKRPATKTAGFHISTLYSPWVRWSEVLAEFLRAKKHPELLQVFVNSVLGEPWQDAVEEADADAIRAKRDKAGFDRNVVPPGVKVIIVAADVQKHEIWYVIRGWGEFRRSWLIAEGACATLEDLYEIATRPIPIAGAKQTMQAMYAAIDTGHRTFEVYDFVKAHPGFLAVKGQPAKDYPVRPARVEYTPKGSLRKRSILLHHVNTPHYKEALFRLMNVADGDPGEWHVHRETTDDYCEQVTSEHQVWRELTIGHVKRRALVWEPRRAHAANHLLDAEVYGMAIADAKGVWNLRPERPKPPPRKREPPNPRDFLSKGRRIPAR